MKRTFDFAEISGTDRYKLLTGLVVPRPIGWVGTRGADGVDNLAPFSFFTVAAGTPPTVLFVPGRTVREKDTLVNVAATGSFTLSVVSFDLAEAMNATSATVPSGVDEFAMAGLTKVEGSRVLAPMVGEAAANFECRVTHIHEVEQAASVVFGEVLAAHVAEDLLDGTRIDLERLDAVGRLAGPWYSRVTELFAMERPDDR